MACASGYTGTYAPNPYLQIPQKTFAGSPPTGLGPACGCNASRVASSVSAPVYSGSYNPNPLGVAVACSICGARSGTCGCNRGASYVALSSGGGCGAVPQALQFLSNYGYGSSPLAQPTLPFAAVYSGTCDSAFI